MSSLKRSVGLILLFSFSSFLLLLFLLDNFFNEQPEEEEASMGGEEGRPCRKRSYGHDSFVCVCNAEYCDRPVPFSELDLDDDKMVFYVTSKAEHRLKRFVLEAAQEEIFPSAHEPVHEITVRVNPSEQFQSIFGFGGAFTDSAGINLNGLSSRARERLLAAYFDNGQMGGIRYSLGRMPIGASDFSARGYSYLDTPGDFNLSTFALEREDLEEKIPHILAALRLSNGSLRLLGSPWSAPAWMKTNEEIRHGGQLKGPTNGIYYRTYAEYFKRFLEEYAAKGINFWAISIQNEAAIAEMSGLNIIPSMFMANRTQRDFAHDLLSPLLKESGAGKEVKILAGDDMRDRLLPAAQEIYSHPDKADAIDGLAFHWYTHSPVEELTKVHQMRPDKLLISTEACSGILTGPILGDWWRGWLYGWDILNTLKNWAIGWIDWNLCLDVKGGPNWVNNVVDAPIIVNASADEFYKQPMFYFMAQFSRFIPRDSIRIGSTLLDANGNIQEDTYETKKMIIKIREDNLTHYAPMPSSNQLEHVAFRTPNDDHLVLVLINQANKNSTTQRRNVRIEEEEKEEGDGSGGGGLRRSWVLPIEPDSIVTAIWRSKRRKGSGGDGANNDRSF